MLIISYLIISFCSIATQPIWTVNQALIAMEKSSNVWIKRIFDFAHRAQMKMVNCKPLIVLLNHVLLDGSATTKVCFIVAPLGRVIADISIKVRFDWSRVIVLRIGDQNSVWKRKNKGNMSPNSVIVWWKEGKSRNYSLTLFWATEISTQECRLKFMANMPPHAITTVSTQFIFEICQFFSAYFS